jgi:hypothetical protein
MTLSPVEVVPCFRWEKGNVDLNDSSRSSDLSGKTRSPSEMREPELFSGGKLCQSLPGKMVKHMSIRQKQNFFE